MDAINASRQAQLQERSWRERLLVGDDYTSTFYVIRGRRQKDG